MISEKYSNGIKKNGAEEQLDLKEPPPNILSNNVYPVEGKIYANAEVLETAKLEIKREGDQRCPCGSGKKAQDCCLMHLRLDLNPGATRKEFRMKEIEPWEDDLYDNSNPPSHKAYALKGGVDVEEKNRPEEGKPEKPELDSSGKLKPGSNEGEELCPCGSGLPKKECCFREIEEIRETEKEK